MTPTTPKKEKLQSMIAELDAIINDALLMEKNAAPALSKVHPKNRKSACNLLHYRALQKHDLRKLQKKLDWMGLSRLANSQPHVMASLRTNKAILEALLHNTPLQLPANELSFKKGHNARRTNLKKLLGPRPAERRTRIMVTLPTQAADDPQLVVEMLMAGMNCARINCAHDDPDIWMKMTHNIRNASAQTGRKCKIAMDLAGPKIRTGPVVEGPGIVKLRPPKDIYGKWSAPLPLWLGSNPRPGLPHIPIAENDLARLNDVKTLYLTDTRQKNRTLHIIKKETGGYMAHCHKTTYLETGMPLYFDKNKKNDAIHIGELPHKKIPIPLKNGDLLRLDKDPLIGEPAAFNDKGELISKAHISCSCPEIFAQVKPGHRVLFDDGKIEGIVKKVTKESLLIKITRTPHPTAKLRSEKEINFPDSNLHINGLTEQDKKDLAFIAQHADVAGFSFVNRPDDVYQIIEELEKINAKNQLGVILKIETRIGFHNLTDILLAAMHLRPIGVMIARSNLAVETGWNNIGRVQQEILSTCMAAHITDVWATQVPESLAIKGLPSHPEVTDTFMAQRADCVMLNKGPYIIEAIQSLNAILTVIAPADEVE